MVLTTISKKALKTLQLAVFILINILKAVTDKIHKENTTIF